MNKKILLATITSLVVWSSCGKGVLGDNIKQNEFSKAMPSINNIVAAKMKDSVKTNANNKLNDMIDYRPYIKKVWVEDLHLRNGEEDTFSFCITSISNGKINGKYSPLSISVPNGFPQDDFSGTIKNGIATCHLDSEDGIEMKILFEPNNEIKVSFKVNTSSVLSSMLPTKAITLKPYNIKDDFEGDIKFSVIKTFMVNLNSWGNIQFVAGKLGDETRLFLTNKNGDIFFEFTLFSFVKEIKDVAFVDVNKDNLKDFIIISEDPDDEGNRTTTVCLQEPDGELKEDIVLNDEINAANINKDVRTVTDYISQNYKSLFEEE